MIETGHRYAVLGGTTAYRAMRNADSRHPIIARSSVDDAESLQEGRELLANGFSCSTRADDSRHCGFVNGGYAGKETYCLWWNNFEAPIFRSHPTTIAQQRHLMNA